MKGEREVPPIMITETAPTKVRAVLGSFSSGQRCNRAARENKIVLEFRGRMCYALIGEYE